MHRRMSAFEYWMRTGIGPDGEPAQYKFNPWHDPEDGRFTFANRGNYFGAGGSIEHGQHPVSPHAAKLPSRPSRGPSVAAMRRYVERVKREAREREAFKKHVLPEEGDRDVVYKDSLGKLTVGIGHLVTPDDHLNEGDRITTRRKEALWRTDADRALSAAKRQMQDAGITDQRFLLPLASVNFQLDVDWYRDHTNTWDLIKDRRYAAAAREAENSLWFEQTPNRVRAFQQALNQLERAERAKAQSKKD